MGNGKQDFSSVLQLLGGTEIRLVLAHGARAG